MSASFRLLILLAAIGAAGGWLANVTRAPSALPDQPVGSIGVPVRRRGPGPACRLLPGRAVARRHRPRRDPALGRRHRSSRPADRVRRFRRRHPRRLHPGRVRLYEAGTGRVRHQFATDEPCRSATFSPDGRYLLTDHPAAGVRVWDVRRAR